MPSDDRQCKFLNENAPLYARFDPRQLLQGSIPLEWMTGISPNRNTIQKCHLPRPRVIDSRPQFAIEVTKGGFEKTRRIPEM